MVGTFLALGFLLGLRHALEADHVAAVAALGTRSRSPWQRLQLAGAWGLGHSGTLLLVGAALVLGGLAMPDGVARTADGAAGLLVALLGADVLRRLWRDRVHVHVHRHDDGTVHAHAHAHAAHPAHDHPHPTRPLSRAWLVGTLHGVGGSAAVVLLSLQAAHSAGQALGYIALFGAGTVLGMLALAVALPVRFFGRALELAVGVASIAVGAVMFVGALQG